MPSTPLHFELPENLSVTKFLDRLSQYARVQIAAQQFALKSFYDSFDWRLYHANLICELNQSSTTSCLTIYNRLSGKTIASANMQEVPEFVNQFTDPLIKSALATPLSIRALLSIGTLPNQTCRINILDKEQKTVVHLIIEEHEWVSNRIILKPLQGYEKKAEHMRVILEKSLYLKPAAPSLLKEYLKLQGRKPKDYSSKLHIELAPDMRADMAGKYVFRHLLTIIKANEAGIIANIDSEFLHDFRVAVRKTRSGLSQLKHIFPDDIKALYAEYFSWLGQITGPTRDLDVYLLNFENYRNNVPASLSGALEPLYECIAEKQKAAQRKLAKKLQSEHYLSTLATWERFLLKPVPKKPTPQNARRPIKQLSDRRIWKCYQQILRMGNRITDNSPAESLHDLRKLCKKLRYLMEFFQTLYPEQSIQPLIKALKDFQEVLGNFHDYQIQQITLKSFAEQMLSDHVPVDTFLAMGVLVQNLETRRLQARNDFSSRFTDFKQAKNKHIENLFSNSA